MAAKQIILMATARREALKPFTQALEADDQVMLIPAFTMQEALETAVRVVPVLVIIDQQLDDDKGLDLVRQLLRVNAFLYTAVLSDMDEAVFHERSEGLGVLMRLPMHPDGSDAKKLLSLLREMAPCG